MKIILQLSSNTLIRDREKFIGGMGPVQKAMGRPLFFIALKHGADTFLFFGSLRPWGEYIFSTTLKPKRSYLQKKMQLHLYFSLK